MHKEVLQQEKMQIDQKIELLTVLGEHLSAKVLNKEFTDLFRKAKNANAWFTEDNCSKAMLAIAQQFLKKDTLREFIANYPLAITKSLNIGIVTAGNIPLVGFHDVLCTFLSGHTAYIKLSREDSELLLYILDFLKDLEPETAKLLQIKERLNNVEALIATGSDNTAQHFDYYFKEKPRIIRRNRTSVAVLKGSESNMELRDLGEDIFSYFGLGCRNVSKLYVPKDYHFETFFESIELWNTIQLHHKYNNNYDYNKSIYLVNREEHLDNGFLLLKKDHNLVSPLAVLYYQEYENEDVLQKELDLNKDKIQCIVGRDVAFGKSQEPALHDFADGVDTMKFLTNLN